MGFWRAASPLTGNAIPDLVAACFDPTPAPWCEVCRVPLVTDYAEVTDFAANNSITCLHRLCLRCAIDQIERAA